jgi:hypothetical protein
MTVIARVHAARPVPGPCLTTGPWAGPVIIVLFVMSVGLFVFGLLAL